MRQHALTIVLFLLLLAVSLLSIFVGVIGLDLAALLAGNLEQLEILLISRLPRLLAILCTGIGMSTAGLIMQQLCQNKFVSPTTGATISSAQLGILFALVCDLLGRVVIAPYELPIERIVGILGSILFIGLLLYRLNHGRKAVRLFRTKGGTV